MKWIALALSVFAFAAPAAAQELSPTPRPEILSLLTERWSSLGHMTVEEYVSASENLQAAMVLQNLLLMKSFMERVDLAEEAQCVFELYDVNSISESPLHALIVNAMPERRDSLASNEIELEIFYQSRNCARR